MAVKESAVNAAIRWQKLEILQGHYSEFIPFLRDVMELLGFTTSEIQEDIGKFIAYGPDYLMVQAQRSQAKTTIAASFAIWDLIHNPHHRVLIMSAGGSQASDISTLIVRVIMTMDVLECLRPDTTNGDRSSVEAFDVHYTLKGIDKSPSVKCMGITANLQGNRADILLADDVESMKNSLTATMRAQLLERTLDFSSICTSGRIIWLGTPQSRDSIYNTLPGRGVTVRIWPGRYPTVEQESVYGDSLAPLLKRRMAADPSLRTGGGIDGHQGQPIEGANSGYLDEHMLQRKELDQGVTWFQLQHMLNTSLSDALRYPLKLNQLLLMNVRNKAPMIVERAVDASRMVDQRVHEFGFRMSYPHEVSPELREFDGIICYIDPAGGGLNADETAYAVTGFLNGNVYALEVGGIPGGYDKALLQELAERVSAWKPQTVIIEKNMGFGAFREVFLPIMAALHKCAVEDDYVTGQKEKRIISTLEPVIGRGALIINESVIERDVSDCARYAARDRLTYSLFYQMAKITIDRGSLVHDDRLDALEGAVRYWQDKLAIDQQESVARQREKDYLAMIADPLGKRRNDPPKRGSLFNKYAR